MNSLLREASDALPGRYHYALLRWPGATPFAEASAEDVAVKSASYQLMGIRPIWFDGFGEIPALIATVA